MTNMNCLQQCGAGKCPGRRENVQHWSLQKLFCIRKGCVSGRAFCDTCSFRKIRRWFQEKSSSQFNLNRQELKNEKRPEMITGKDVVCFQNKRDLTFQFRSDRNSYSLAGMSYCILRTQWCVSSRTGMAFCVTNSFHKIKLWKQRKLGWLKAAID